MNEYQQQRSNPPFTLPWMPLGIILGLLLALPCFHSSLFDDAYIHARISENALHSGIPVFNPDQIFKVDSSSGFVFLIAALSRYLGTLHAIRLITALSVFLTIYGIFWLSKFNQRKPITTLFTILCSIPPILIPAYGGMESPIVCVLMVAACIAYCHDKHWLTILLIACCTPFRFETILLLFLVCIYYIRVYRRWSLLIYTAPFFAYIVIDYYLFRTIIPYAAKAKSIGYGQPFSLSIYHAICYPAPSSKVALIPGLVLCIIILIKIYGLIRRKLLPEISDIFYFFSAGLLTAWMFSHSIIFPWYSCLLSFPLALAFLLPTRTILTPSPLASTTYAAELFTLTRFGALSSYLVLAQFGFIGHNNSRYRIDHYQMIASSLYAYCPSCTLASSEIGALGYAFHGRVYDTFGIADPDARRFHPMAVPEERSSYGVGAIPPQYIEFHKPDFVVSMPCFSEAFRASNVLSRYITYDCPFNLKGNNTIWGDTKIQVFSRTSLPSRMIENMGCIAK
jgi:hypothetical protein